jgi:hypothetical protein
VLTPFDDYPVHQTPEPIAHPATGDRNAYDRYFFNGYDRDGELFFAAALGVYPNRDVMDAAFSVVRSGVQTSVHASRRLPLDRTQTSVGPVTVEVLEPLRRHRVRLAANESGVAADLVFTARSEAIEEPRFTMARGTRTVMDYTRLTQFGSWEGTLTVDGERIDVGGDVLGSRDRSWGIRGVGEREGGAPGPMPQFFWLWAPLNFDDEVVHFDVQEDADGRQWHANGERWPLLPAGEGARMAAVEHRITWRPGTRRAAAAELILRPHAGDPVTVELEPVLDFQMLGLGYLHPEWGHGMWKGEDAVGVESWKLADLDPLLPHHLHVQQLVRARVGDRTGTGILEQLVIGPHAPSGFADLLDGAG